MSKNPESFVNSYNNSNTDEKIKETVKEISKNLIGSRVNLYYQGKNISVILENVDNNYGHSIVNVEKRTVLKDGQIWQRHSVVTVANEEITIDPVKKSKIVKAPKEVQHISTKF